MKLLHYEGAVERDGEFRLHSPELRAGQRVRATLEVSEAPERPTRDEFWQPYSLQELIAMHGVQPVQTFENLLGGWPEDEEFDPFLNSIYADRTEDRQMESP